MPYEPQVATGHRARLQVFGKDYNTPDGTGVRDYIHVLDLAQGHVAALRHCRQAKQELLTVNLGTGTGYSVLDMVQAFEQDSGKTVAYDIAPRLPGAIATSWADTNMTFPPLGLRPNRGLPQNDENYWTV